MFGIVTSIFAYFQPLMYNCVRERECCLFLHLLLFAMYLKRDDNLGYQMNAPNVCTNKKDKPKKYEKSIVHIERSHAEQDKRLLKDKILLKKSK